MTVERWERGGMRMTWTAETRLIEMSFTASETRATGPMAQEFLDQFERWTRTSTGFGLLVDCANVVDTEPAWRRVLNGHFRVRRYPVRIAWYNASLLIRVAVEMFVLVTPNVDGKVFREEADARSFLRTGGFGP